MNELEAISARHSVRSYTDQPISAEVRTQLESAIAQANKEGNIHMTLVCDEPHAFDSTMAHYGKFSGVANYIVLAGSPADDLQERCGYYGDRVALLAQSLGLNTCWVALTFKRRYVKKYLAAGEKLQVVISLGYGETQGISRKSKAFSEVSDTPAESAPEWYRAGVDAALLAPTAMNQQKFRFALIPAAEGAKSQVKLSNLGGAYSKVDLGIVKYHFEAAAGRDNFTWA